jgi:hypothetical protein
VQDLALVCVSDVVCKPADSICWHQSPLGVAVWCLIALGMLCRHVCVACNQFCMVDQVLCTCMQVALCCSILPHTLWADASLTRQCVGLLQHLLELLAWYSMHVCLQVQCVAMRDALWSQPCRLAVGPEQTTAPGTGPGRWRTWLSIESETGLHVVAPVAVGIPAMDVTVTR